MTSFSKLRDPANTAEAVRMTFQWRDNNTPPELPPLGNRSFITGSYTDAIKEREHITFAGYTDSEIEEARDIADYIDTEADYPYTSQANFNSDPIAEDYIRAGAYLGGVRVDPCLLDDAIWRQRQAQTTRVVLQKFALAAELAEHTDLLPIGFCAEPLPVLHRLAAEDLVTAALLRQRTKQAQTAFKPGLYFSPLEVVGMFQQSPDGRGIQRAVDNLHVRKYLIPGFLRYVQVPEHRKQGIPALYKAYMQAAGLKKPA